MAGLGRESWWVKAPRVIAAAVRGYWLYVLAALALVFLPLLVLVKIYGIADAALWTLLGTGAILALLVVALAVAYGISRDIRYRLTDNNYGLCSGSNGAAATATDDSQPLTDWLHKFFQEVGNKTFDDDPLTFGDLWANGGDPRQERDIDLVLMTTNITRGISQRLPFLEGSWGQLYFKEEEFRKLFPAKVVDWMTRKAAPVRRGDKVDATGYCALPAPADLPILLGARMSLSFPFLLSAVPLWAANVTQKNKTGKFGLERCWFSDGGSPATFRSTSSIRRCRRGRPSASISSPTVSPSVIRLRPGPTWVWSQGLRLAGCPSETPLPGGRKYTCQARTRQGSARRHVSTSSRALAASSARCSTPRATGPTPS